MTSNSPMVRAGRESFFNSATEVTRLGICPEIQLAVATDLQSVWFEQEVVFGRAALPPPYWSVPWPGGQALARYILDNPSLVAGRTVLDAGAGCGLCAIAAALSGGRVTAVDTDPVACLAIATNARLNRVSLATACIDAVNMQQRFDLVLAADLWYERFMAHRISGWLRGLVDDGTEVYLGDLGRAYFPRHGVVERARFRVDAASFTERGSETEARVWQLVVTGLAA